LDQILLYDGARVSVLLFTMLLIDWQVRFGVAQCAMQELFLILAATFPAGNRVPPYRRARKIAMDTAVAPGMLGNARILDK
jgi:hypothetical protein